MSIRRLIIMRHATAAGPGDGNDHSRPLTVLGRTEARAVGTRLAALGAVPDRVLSSSARRCTETVESLASGLGMVLAADFDRSLYNAAPAELLHGLAGDPISSAGNSETLLLLAHNPGVSMLAFELGSGDPGAQGSLRSGFAPATFALFEIEPTAFQLTRRSTRLVRFERPDD